MVIAVPYRLSKVLLRKIPLPVVRPAKLSWPYKMRLVYDALFYSQASARYLTLCSLYFHFYLPLPFSIYAFLLFFRIKPFAQFLAFQLASVSVRIGAAFVPFSHKSFDVFTGLAWFFFFLSMLSRALTLPLYSLKLLEKIRGALELKLHSKTKRPRTRERGSFKKKAGFYCIKGTLRYQCKVSR